MATITNNELGSRLWSCADEMRKTMTADQYKNYLLGLVFYKSLSDHELYEVMDLLENRKPETICEAQAYYGEQVGSDDWDDLVDELENKFDYAIPPEATYEAFMKKIREKTFMLSELKQAFRDIEQCKGSAYIDLFSSFDIDDKALGATPAKRNALISTVMEELDKIDFTEYGNDALGDAYEYLISQFAAESGKKAGEFYTPQSVAQIIARIVTYGKEKKHGFTVYDPCCGSGSLLIQPKNYMYVNPYNPNEDYTRHMSYHGQEVKTETYTLARMNLMLHNIKSQNRRLSNADTLDEDWPSDEPTNFDAVVMNPPYSQPWSAVAGFLQDPRFQPYEKLAPKSAADFAFLLHGFYHLKDDGTMGIVLPHGVLFRGNAEGTIRKHLLENGSIYAVIGLPAGIFFSTGIPTCIIILKKSRTERDVLFIDASKEFTKVKAQNILEAQHIEKIVEAYKGRTDIDKFCHLASYDEIVENEYNLNIPRYVDTFDPEAPVDLTAVCTEISKLETEQAEAEATLKKSIAELTGSTDEDRAMLTALKNLLGGE